MAAVQAGVRVVGGAGCSLPAVVSRARSSAQTPTKLGLKGVLLPLLKDLSSILACSSDGKG